MNQYRDNQKNTHIQAYYIKFHLFYFGTGKTNERCLSEMFKLRISSYYSMKCIARTFECTVQFIPLKFEFSNVYPIALNINMFCEKRWAAKFSDN